MSDCVQVFNFRVEDSPLILFHAYVLRLSLSLSQKMNIRKCFCRSWWSLL